MITVQIGNTDDKLGQAEWSSFLHDTCQLVNNVAQKVYFSGHSFPSAPWQNAAWCFECNPEDQSIIKIRLAELAKEFRQDSIAWTSGETTFLSLD